MALKWQIGHHTYLLFSLSFLGNLKEAKIDHEYHSDDEQIASFSTMCYGELKRCLWCDFPADTRGNVDERHAINPIMCTK